MQNIKKKALLMSVLMVAMSLAACNNGGNSVSSKKGGQGGGSVNNSGQSADVTDSSGKKKSSSGFVFSSVEQQDLPKYEVKVDYDNGTDPTVSEVECGQGLQKPANPTVPAGKAFYGWMNVKNGGQIWDFESDDLNMVMGDVELKPLFVDANVEAQPFEAELCPAITESLGKKDGEIGMDGETYSGGQKGKGLIARAYKKDDGTREWNTSGDYYRDEDGVAHLATAADKADSSKNVFGGLVHYFYVKGNALIWEIESPAAVENAPLFMRLSGEYGLDEPYQVRQGEGENRVTESFNDTSFPVKVNGVAQQYGAITIHNIIPKTFIDFQDFFVGNVNLNAGKNTIELLVDNNDSLNGTITSSAPVIDCIKLYSSSTLTWPAAKLSQMDKDVD